jgi:hypothetical protein
VHNERERDGERERDRRARARERDREKRQGRGRGTEKKDLEHLSVFFSLSGRRKLILRFCFVLGVHSFALY